MYLQEGAQLNTQSTHVLHTGVKDLSADWDIDLQPQTLWFPHLVFKNGCPRLFFLSHTDRNWRTLFPAEYLKNNAFRDHSSGAGFCISPLEPRLPSIFLLQQLVLQVGYSGSQHLGWEMFSLLGVPDTSQKPFRNHLSDSALKCSVKFTVNHLLPLPAQLPPTLPSRAVVNSLVNCWCFADVCYSQSGTVNPIHTNQKITFAYCSKLKRDLFWNFRISQTIISSGNWLSASILMLLH